MAQPLRQQTAVVAQIPDRPLEDAAIVIHSDGYELIEVDDTEPTESEAVQRQIDALPDDPGGAAFNAAAHPTIRRWRWSTRPTRSTWPRRSGSHTPSPGASTCSATTNSSGV